MTTYYKFTDENGQGRFSGVALPINEWIEIDGPLVICSNGIHFCRMESALEWADVRCHTVEFEGEVIHEADKSCARRVRISSPLDTWNERSIRLLAADYAEHVLHIFEAKHPTDDRPRKAIEASRAFARGEIGRAAWAAVGDAAWDAARGAVGDAAWAAVRPAAWDAARGAARAAAWDAAMDAERNWQIERLRMVLDGEIHQ